MLSVAVTVPVPTTALAAGGVERLVMNEGMPSSKAPRYKRTPATTRIPARKVEPEKTLMLSTSTTIAIATTPRPTHDEGDLALPSQRSTSDSSSPSSRIRTHPAA